jgi:serine/threonine protein kinase/ABC-type branched-subunit amino acid transport system substrate-binding protein
MLTLQCPGCGKAVAAVSGGDPVAHCPFCSCVLVPSGEETCGNEPPTRLNTSLPELSFLSPPRQPGELGWLGPYRILKLIGSGGMGIVFQAEDTDLERRVALKVMHNEAARDPVSCQRFLREARMTAAVHSDYIINIHQVGQHNDRPFFAMELLHGETLAARLHRGDRPNTAQFLDLALQIARGLEAAHEAGLIHRDIKPGNIWLETKDEVRRRKDEQSKDRSDSSFLLHPSSFQRAKILDFGLARPAEDTRILTRVGMAVGTPAYMSPEQAEGKEVDGRSDLFSLGCVLYEVASGEPPFPGSSVFAVLTAVAFRDPRPLAEVNPSLPKELAELVMRMLAKKPEERPASASAVVEALEAITDAHPELQLATRSGRKSGSIVAAPLPWRRRRRLAILAGLAGIAGILAILFVFRGWLFHSGGHSSRSTAQGVTSDTILLGMSAPFTGPANELGRSLQVGIQTWINHINDEGGITGRKLSLIALDDEYEPERAIANMRELAEEYKVFAFIGNVGTPTAVKTVPYVLQKRMLFFAPFTGADLLRRTPPDRYVFNYRASLAEETAAAVNYLMRAKKIQSHQIAVFAQEDSYGHSGFRGVERVLRKHGHSREQILRVGYPRNTIQVERAAQQIIQHREIRAVVMVPTYRPAARFVQRVKDARKDVLFTSTSFVDCDALATELTQLGPEYAEGVIVTQVVPPVDSHASTVLKYREMLRRYHPSEKANSVSLEGYLSAALLTEGLRRAGEELTTETLIDALESIHHLDLGIGVSLRFGPSEHQASHQVWGIIVNRSGRYQALELD